MCRSLARHAENVLRLWTFLRAGFYWCSRWGRISRPQRLNCGVVLMWWGCQCAVASHANRLRWPLPLVRRGRRCSEVAQSRQAAGVARQGRPCSVGLFRCRRGLARARRCEIASSQRQSTSVAADGEAGPRRVRPQRDLAAPGALWSVL